MSGLTGGLLGNLLWLAILAAWIMLLLIGLEADKPLSGDLPGQVDRHAVHSSPVWDGGDRLGEAASWVAFGLVCAALPFVLYWVFAVHIHLPRLPGVPM